MNDRVRGAPRPGGGRRFLSLGTKLAAITSCVLVLVSSCLFVELTARERAKLIASKTSAAAMVTELLANEVAAAIDFGDADDTATQLGHLKTNPDIVGAAVWPMGSPKPIAEWLTTGGEAMSAPAASEPDGAFVSAEWLVTTRTVVNPKGKNVARLRVTFSLRPENDAFRASRRNLFWMAAGFTLATALLLSLFARRYVIRPLHRLAHAARALAAGDLSARVEVQTSDEIGELTRAFNQMGEAVAVRQKQVESRNADMTLVLDHVAQGLFTIDRAGVISPEYSQALVRWLGAPVSGETLWDYFGKFDRELGERLRFSWEAVVEEILPIELTLDQMPRGLRRGEQHLRLGYLPILVDGALSKVLVVLSDVTSEVASERADAAQRELLQLFEQFNKDRAGFSEFVAEADGLVAKILEPAPALIDQKRWLHTLKGNCAQFGLTTIADCCHQLESNMLGTGDLLGELDRAELRRAWSEARAKLSTLLGDSSGASIEIHETEFDELLRGLDVGASQARLAQTVRRWRLEPMARRLDRIARHARGIASRLGKKGVHVAIEPNAIRLDARTWAPFWGAFVHVIRNALDHGIESAEERAAAGKQGAGTLTIRTYVAGDELIIEAADDGRGIDWDALALRSSSLGNVCTTRKEVEEALLRGGVSTKSEVTAYSGRGIGMGAVSAACAELGGKLRVHSARGKGTVVQFRFPATAVGDGWGHVLSEPSFGRKDIVAVG